MLFAKSFLRPCIIEKVATKVKKFRTVIGFFHHFFDQQILRYF